MPRQNYHQTILDWEAAGFPTLLPDFNPDTVVPAAILTAVEVGVDLLNINVAAASSSWINIEGFNRYEFWAHELGMITAAHSLTLQALPVTGGEAQDWGAAAADAINVCSITGINTTAGVHVLGNKVCASNISGVTASTPIDIRPVQIRLVWGTAAGAATTAIAILRLWSDK